MRQSVTLKWIASLALASLVGIGLIAFVTDQSARSEFNQLLLNQAQDDFIAIATGYYADNGSWRGFDMWFRRVYEPQRRPSTQGNNNGNRNNQQNGNNTQLSPVPNFAVVDPNGIVVKGAGQLRLGDSISPARIRTGEPILIDSEQIGTVISLNVPPELDPREREFIARTNEALIIGAIGAMAAALLIGGVLARQLTRPMRELTAAIRAMNKGQLRQEVPVRTRDELGELTTAFNQMSAELDRSNRLRRQMTADIAHDLRTPLTVISGYLEGMRDGTLKPTVARFDAMFSEATQLRRLIDDLRTLSLADAGKLKLERQSIPVESLVNGIVTSFAPLAQSGEITLIASTAPGLPPIHIDRERMAQVLGNLVSNALRYTPSGGKIIIAAQRSSTQTRLSVCDTGEGIEPEKLPYIFERFYRVDEARTDSESGLGLAIARSIVVAHGGSIHAESAPGKGTTIHIDLPIAAEAA